MDYQERVLDAAKRLDLTWTVDIEQERDLTHYAMQPEYVTIHNAASPWTGAKLNSYNHYCIRTSGDGRKSWHLSCGEDGVYQALPFARNAWHAGDGDYGTGNRKSIGIEIARDLSPDASQYAKAEDVGARAAACLLYAYGLSVDRLKKHQDWSGKYCPHRILREGRWEEFKAVVNKYLKQLGQENDQSTSGQKEPVETPEKEPENNKPVTFYRVMIKPQLGSFTSKGNAERLQGQVEEALQKLGLNVEVDITEIECKR